MKRSLMIAVFLTAGVPALGQAPPIQSSPPATQPQAAPQSPTPRKIDAARETEIRKLLELSGSTKIGEEMVAGSVEQLRTTLTNSLPEGEHSQKIVDSFLRRYKARFTSEQLTALIVPIYDKYLNEEDLKALIQFYESPLGQRAVKILPQVARESQQVGYDFGQKVVQEVVKEVQDEFPELKQGKPPDKP